MPPRDSELSPAGYGAADFDLPIVSCAENAYISAEAEYNVGTSPTPRAAQDGLTCQEASRAWTSPRRRPPSPPSAGSALLEEIMNQKYTACS